jgi:hypothetical protein
LETPGYFRARLRRSGRLILMGTSLLADALTE